MTGAKSHEQAPYSVGRCSECGKQCFRSRKAAKRHVAKLFPGDRMSIYTCGEFFHFGHTPYSVKNSMVSRNDYTRPPR